MNSSNDLECNHLIGTMGVTQRIKDAMYDAAKQFVYIGFLLWEVREYKYYRENGYQNVYEYAEAELGFKISSTKNLIAICVQFCKRCGEYKETPTKFLYER
jgi:transposase